MAESNSPDSSISCEMISIEIRKIYSLNDRLVKSEILELKRTLKAKMKRFVVQEIETMPIAVLPGSSQRFSVQVDSNMNYYLTAHPLGDSDVIYHVEDSIDRKVSQSLEKDSGEKLLEAICLTQKYIKGLAQRLKSDNIEENLHVLVPYDLFSTMVAIEGVFQDGGANEITDLKNGCDKLRHWLNDRIKNLKSEMETLSGYLSEDGSGETQVEDTVSNNPDRILIPEEDWHEHHQGLEYFLDQSQPSEFNREFVIKSVKNILHDFLFPGEEWISKNPVHRVTKDIKSLSLRINSSAIDYKEVLSKLDPIEKALESERNTNPNLEYQTAKSECEDIRSICNEEFSVKKVVCNPPKLLNSQIMEFITKNKLYTVMTDVIKNNFKSHYEALLKKEGGEKLSDKKLNDTFSDLNAIKYNFDKALEFYEEVRLMLQDHSTTKDVGVVRKESEIEISGFIKNIRETMMTEADLSALTSKSEKELKKAEEYKENIEEELSANASDESVFWIGLGQAGGQILRECLLYCMNNLSDARCRALMSALGAKKEDLQKIQRKIKDLYSSDDGKKLDAEKDMKRIFHNKIHLLAVNLGEEVDALADDDQPGYFLWGKKLKFDNSTRTDRKTRNIMKLKLKGEGAGGETGVGRAYGFRFSQDLTDVMKDVGKKGRSSPKHIVITHSLAGGSGSGMVLPVLQQARRTFGQDTVIWVVSVGEGASEARSVAKVNTPFIISDILQATYDGIHAIHKPIEFSDWRSFIGEISQTSDNMDKLAKKFVGELGGSNSNVDLLQSLSTIFDGGFRDKFLDSIDNWNTSLEDLKSIELSKNFGVSEGNNPINIGKILDGQLVSSLDKNEFSEIIRILNSLLPDDKEQSNEFSNWCEFQARGGIRPARDFWMNWVDCIYDPFSLFLEGRVKQHQTIADDDASDKQYFMPSLSKNHLKAVMNQVDFDLFPLDNDSKNYGEISDGMIPLKKAIVKKITDIVDIDDKKKKLSEINQIIEKYGTSLNKFNSILEKMTIHIQSLSGTGNDRLIKSIIVSNSHLEKGITSTNNLESSGKAYTVYNSVIFDLMLNIIGPRLPAERGVFAHMEETFDHMDMVKSTNPPLVVGLLNQRDSISLTDTPEGSRDKIDSDEISTLFSSMFTQGYANNDSSELSNPMFVKKSQILGLPRLFLSLFGSRYRYMLQVDPYMTMKNSSLKSENLEEYCQKLAKLWDTRENRIFEVGPYNREVLMKQQGITGAHIANLVKWISLIDKNCLSRFMGRNIVESVELCQQMTGAEKIWDMVRSGPKPTFDIGVLRTDSSIGRFLEKDSKFNENHLEKGLSSLGVHNAEILRSIGPAYLSSFLPIELLFSIVSDSIRVDTFDYRSFGLSESSFSEHVAEIEMDIKGFASTVIETIRQNHGLNATGIVNDPEGIIDTAFEHYNSELNCVLDHFDLKLIRNGSKFKLRLHPRLNRYFSAVRDIPTRSVDKLLPARSAPASLSRYLNSDSLDKPLDPDYIRENRTGIASPTFTLGGNIINQMRYMSLLPDEGKLSLIPLMRILMLGTGDKSELEKRLGYQLSNIGINLDEISPLVERIFSHRYSKTEVFKEPGIYSNQIMILVNRLNEIRPLLSYLIEKPPSGWSKFDISALNYLIDDVVSKDEITFGGIENTNQIFGSGVESIPNLRSWLHDVVNMLILSSPIGDETDSEPEVLQQWTDDKGHTWRSMDNGTTLWWNPTDKEWKPFDNPTGSNEKEVDESEVIQTVSGGNPVIVGLKQLFYDIAYNFNEALGQAEYLDKDYKNSRSVHFEMTGFSDRLIGKPKGLLILVHDRNPKLPMDSVQQSIRESINYNFGENLGNPKAFSTAADFGPTSYLTVVLQNSPAADISDQFQMLLHHRSEGLAGNNPFWAFENSKLHPYIFLYNLLWLSTRIDKWTDLGNKEYIRRFQIPTGIIEHHFCDPVKLDNDRIRLEKEKQSFPGDIKMPKDDMRDYNTAIKGHLSGIRNILRLIGIMALRYEKAGKLEEKELWNEFELDRTEYAEMVDILMSDANLMEKEHLYRDEVKQSKSKVVNPFLKEKVVSGGGAKDEDTIETRARAWFKAYGAWKHYSKNNPQEDTRVDEASKFEVNFAKPKPDDSKSGEIEIEDLLKEDD